MIIKQTCTQTPRTDARLGSSCKPRRLPCMMFKPAEVCRVNIPFYMEYFAISFFATYMYISINMQKYVFLLICKVYTVFFFFLLFHSRSTIVAENVQNTLARLTYFGFVLFCLNSTNKLSTLLNNDTFNFLLLVYEILFPSMLCDVCQKESLIMKRNILFI